MNDVLAQVYPSRIEAISLLREAPGSVDAAALRATSAKVVLAADAFDTAPASANWRALGEALEIVALLEEWNGAVRGAEVDADRFLRAARLRQKAFAAEQADSLFGSALAGKLAVIGADINPDDVSGVRQALGAIEMPIAIFSRSKPVRWSGPVARAREEHEEVAVAFLEFSIDGRPAESLHSLSAGQIHDLALTLRISRWPAEAEKLVIAPISIEPASTWDFPTFEFARPSGSPPYLIRREGRLALHATQGFNARPLEFRYAAEFHPVLAREERLVVAGQRTLRLDGTDSGRRGITGYTEVDAKIVTLRERLRIEPLVAEQELRDLLGILAPIGNLMGQSVQDNRYPAAIDEATFQRDVLSFLRADPAIGSELEVQPEVAGGRTDLSFRGLRIELKSERTRRLLPEDCWQFAEQAASYAVGTGRRLSLLCVLDCSPKAGPPFPMADGLLIFPVNTGTSPTYVVTCLVQGNLMKPSAMSRPRTKLP
ncbi:hypothetical protein K9B33_22525 [Sphingobium sp. 3R8]|uniref:hypothetical protein n=1 Tax=Sphingobium sp. 3R8 TaxID=2874921 RepID=UPI001CCAA13D|nr:hypothetical protein [Sphingobium sp. 3R8]MBZ9650310.1 hypothetical protein [Sphingobium sp. 3R8]